MPWLFVPTELTTGSAAKFAGHKTQEIGFLELRRPFCRRFYHPFSHSFGSVWPRKYLWDFMSVYTTWILSRYLWFAQIRIILLLDARAAVAGADLLHGKLESRGLSLEHAKHAKHVCHQSHFLKLREQRVWNLRQSWSGPLRHLRTRRSIKMSLPSQGVPELFHSNPNWRSQVSTKLGSTTVLHLNCKLQIK